MGRNPGKMYNPIFMRNRIRWFREWFFLTPRIPIVPNFLFEMAFLYINHIQI